MREGVARRARILASSIALLVGASACPRSAGDTSLPGERPAAEPLRPQPSVSAATGDAGPVAVGPAQPDGLPGPELRARLDELAKCWESLGPPTKGERWGRNGGLCRRWFRREASSGELTLSLVFPQGPDGSIEATEGYARFRAERAPVKVELLVRVPAKGQQSAYAQLLLSRNSVQMASIGLSQKELSALASPATLEQAFHTVIDRANDPSKKDFSKRQECRVLPPSPNLKPGDDGRGQRCEWVPTTPAERESMAAKMRERAFEDQAWVTANNESIHALARELFPYGDASCANRLTGG
jgi:hypothetical protein